MIYNNIIFFSYVRNPFVEKRRRRHIIKQQHIKPDTSTKKYWRNNEQFADLFNAFLFGGQQVIHSEKLQEQDTDSTDILELETNRVSMQGARDLVRLVKTHDGVAYALLALENQDDIHYAMPLRVWGYDYYSYMKQYQEKKAMYRKAGVKLTGAEYISGIRKTDRFVPVVTLVLYYGDEPWDGPQSLGELLEVPEELRPYVNDYQIYVIDMKENNLPLQNQNNKDLFQMMSLLYNYSKDKYQRKQEIDDYQIQHELSEAVIDTLESITGKKIKQKEEKKTMRGGLFEEFRQEGIEVGRQEGRQEAQHDMIISMLRKGKSKEEISDWCEIEISVIQKIEEEMLQMA